MTPLSTLAGQTGRGKYEASLREHYTSVRKRLQGARPPPAKAARAQPLSPFSPRRIRAERAAEAAAKQAREAAVEQAKATWPSYTPPVPYDRWDGLAAEEKSWRMILIEVCAKHHVRDVDVIGPRRQRKFTRARQEAFYRLKTERPDLSFPQIGRFFHRDHTTVLHGVRMHEKRMGLA